MPDHPKRKSLGAETSLSSHPVVPTSDEFDGVKESTPIGKKRRASTDPAENSAAADMPKPEKPTTVYDKWQEIVAHGRTKGQQLAKRQRTSCGNPDYVEKLPRELDIED